MARLLHRLGMLCARRPLVVIGAWVVLLVVVFGAVAKVGALTSNDLSLPGTGSQEAKDLLQDKFPPQQNGANPIVFDITKGKLTDKQYQQAVDDSIKAIKKQPHVYSVTNPISTLMMQSLSEPPAIWLGPSMERMTPSPKSTASPART